jgi:predicted RNase H-like nuclease
MIFVGADGCRAGWFAVVLTDSTDWEVDIFVDVFGLWEKFSTASVILLDVPIGLRDEGAEERRCDVEARKLLGRPRASSVFPTPCRPAVYAKTYQEASNINEKLTKRRLSRQTWNIISKIREVDELLSNNESAKLCVRETHPEVCFWTLAGGHRMEHPKKKEEGFLERRQVLQSVYPSTNDIISYVLNSYRRDHVRRDDVLDALAVAVTAKLGSQKVLVSIPEAPEFDSRGLRMEIVYVSNSNIRD